jgi:hypothetical protein
VLAGPIYSVPQRTAQSRREVCVICRCAASATTPNQWSATGNNLKLVVGNERGAGRKKYSIHQSKAYRLEALITHPLRVKCSGRKIDVAYEYFQFAFGCACCRVIVLSLGMAFFPSRVAKAGDPVVLPLG